MKIVNANFTNDIPQNEEKSPIDVISAWCKIGENIEFNACQFTALTIKKIKSSGRAEYNQCIFIRSIFDADTSDMAFNDCEFVQCDFNGEHKKLVVPVANEQEFDIFYRFRLDQLAFNGCSFFKCEFHKMELVLGNAPNIFGAGNTFHYCDILNLQIEVKQPKAPGNFDLDNPNAPLLYSPKEYGTLVLGAKMIGCDFTGMVLNCVSLEIPENSLCNCRAAHIWTARAPSQTASDNNYRNISIGRLIDINSVRDEYINRLCEGKNEGDVKDDDFLLEVILTEKFSPYLLPKESDRPNDLLQDTRLNTDSPYPRFSPIKEWYKKTQDKQPERPS